ncbi:MAG TPA: hypothetical protein VLR54_05650, partial [Methanobacteriaceae archaeon]|nr:hypothetical protein [Methanobacteriaceae archaeon]
MFDSLKKKFNGTIGKLTEKVSQEAEEEAKSEENSVQNKTEAASQKETDLKSGLVTSEADKSSSATQINVDKAFETVPEEIDSEKEESSDSDSEKSDSKKSFFSRLKRKSSEDTEEPGKSESSV